MKKRKKATKKEKGSKVKKYTKRHRWEIVQLPNGDFQWIVRKGV